MIFLTAETCINLARSFAGESQARSRYQLAAAAARQENLEVIARIFETAAANELVHAEEFMEKIQAYHKGGVENIQISAGYPYRFGTVADNLKAAIEAELAEYEEAYPAFASIAAKEGFAEAAQLWQNIAIVEGVHYQVFQQCAAQLTDGRLFQKEQPIVWRCLHCGYTYTAKSAVLTCPVCGKPVGWMLGDINEKPPALSSSYGNSK